MYIGLPGLGFVANLFRFDKNGPTTHDEKLPVGPPCLPTHVEQLDRGQTQLVESVGDQPTLPYLLAAHLAGRVHDMPNDRLHV